MDSTRGNQICAKLDEKKTQQYGIKLPRWDMEEVKTLGVWYVGQVEVVSIMAF
jgi:hypothetical protein